MLKWFSSNAVFMGSLIAGVFYHIQGYSNIAMFMAWLTLIVSIFVHTERMLDVLVERGGFAVNGAIEGWFNVVVIMIMIWAGWIVTAIAYSLSSILVQAAYKEIEERIRHAEKQPSESAGDECCGD